MYLNMKRTPIVLSFTFFILLALIVITGSQPKSMEGGVTASAPETTVVPMGIAIGGFIALIGICIFITFSVRDVLRS